MERRLFFYTLLILLLLTPFHSIAISQAKDSLRIDSINLVGRDLARAGDFEGAIAAFRSILAIDSNNIRARNNLAIVNKMEGRYNEALAIYLDAADLVKRKKGDDSEELSDIYTNIGIIYNNKKDFEQALQYFFNAERIFEIYGLTDNNNATILYNNIGNVYFYMKDWRKALNSFLKGLEIKQNLNSRGIDISYLNCASAYERLGLVDSARLFYEYAIQSKIDQYGEESIQLINVYNFYSVLLQDNDEAEKAFDYLSQALHIAQSYYPQKHPVISDCHRYMAGWYYAKGLPDKALEHYHQAVLAVVFDFNDKDPYANPSLNSEILSENHLMDALNDKAMSMLLLYKKSKEIKALYGALENFELAVLQAEKMRSSYLGQESKLSITENSHENLSQAIETAFYLYELTADQKFAEKAFFFAEKSKSSVLLASLQEVENKKNLGIPASLQEEEDGLKNEREVYKKKVYEERQRENPDSERLGIWQARLLSLSQQLDSINNYIRTTYPEYAAKYNNEVIDIEGVRKGLKRGQVLLEYAFTDSSLIIFTVDRGGAFLVRRPIAGNYLQNIDLLSHFLRNNDFANNTINDYQDYVNSAYALYLELIKPVEDRIAGKSLIIIPDGELGYIPFEALLTSPSDGDGMDYRNLPYLINDYRTSYSYSATILFSGRKSELKPERNLIAFAPTYEHVGEIKEEKFPSYRDYSTYLVPLRFISQEIQNISNIMSSDRYMGFDATEEAFRKEAPRYDILHLAMHTLINDENPMYSQLVFTLNNDTLEDNDGLLNTYEIFNIKLAARMAVLSACNTGYGQLRKGEGVMSLARGFIYAGVPSIIMTLWAVEDQSGSMLMSKFYENLVDGDDIDEALRQAKLQYLQSADQLRAHPYLWSGYVSIGSTDPLKRSGLSLFYYLGTGVGVIALLIAVVLFIRKKRA